MMMLAYSIAIINIGLFLNGMELVASDCNWATFGLYPLVEGTCSYAGGNSWYATCVGGDGYIFEYNSNDCTGGTINITMSNAYSCGNAGECDGVLMDIGLYSGDECSGSELNEGILYLAQVTDECFYLGQSIYVSLTTNATGISYGISSSSTCDTIDIIRSFSSGYCVGNGNSTLWEFSGIILAGQTTTETVPTTTYIPDCNFALYDIYPFINGECSYLEDRSFGSMMVECASNGESATITQYSTYDCTGDAIDTIDADTFYCDASGNDCNQITMSISYYVDNEDCDDSVDKNGEFIMAEFNNVCLDYSGAYLSLSLNTNGLFAGLYSVSGCQGTYYGGFNLTNDECISSGSNSTMFDFSGDSTDSTDSSDSSSSSSSSMNGNSSTDSNSTSGESGGNEKDSAIAVYAQGYFIILLSLVFVIVIFEQYI